jgi:hypothetical protein
VRGRGRPVHDRHSSKSPQANNNNTSNSSITLRQLPVSGSNKHSLEHKRSPNTDRPTAAKHNNGIYQKKHAGNRRSSSELAHENQTVNNINNNNNGANELNGLSAMKPNLLKLPTNTEAQQERIPPTNMYVQCVVES